MTPKKILTDLNTNIRPAVADLTNSVQTAIAAMNALKDKAAVQTDKADELFALTPADVTMPNGDIVPNFAKVRDDLQAAITAFTSVAYLKATDQAVDSAKLEGKTLLEISTEIKSAIIDGAPAIYDTLKEISDALGDDDTAINNLLTQLSTLSTSLDGLSATVADKAPAAHTHTIANVTGLQTALDSKSDTTHTHTIANVTGLQTALDDKAPAVHEHDSRYYTQSQVNAALVGFKNYIINGGFDVAQRGTSHTITQFPQYTLDRFSVWSNGSTVGTKTVTQETLYGNEGFKTKKFLKHTNTTLGTGETATVIFQRIEDARTLGGKTVTFSCWVNFSMNIIAGQLGFFIAQNFNGGSPNTVTNLYTNSSTIPANTWVKITGTATLPQTSGKTINASSSLVVDMVITSQAGLVTNTAEWQLEEGSVATPFEVRPYGLELSLCQRYFERRRLTVSAPTTTSNYGGSVPVNISNTFRVSPSFSVSSVLSSSNWVGSLICSGSNFGAIVFSSAQQTTAGAYIDTICDFSAEL